MRPVPFKNMPPNPVKPLTTVDVSDNGSSRFTTTTIRAGNRTLCTRTRRDADVNTVWTLEHLLKDTDDLHAWLDLPEQDDIGCPDISGFLAAEEALGNAGIVMVDIADPLCYTAALFEMGLYTVIALTEPALFHAALQKNDRVINRKVEAIARALPGRLWRIVGPEYASPPYLPPELFCEYVVRYDTPLVKTIQASGGYARIHSHGNLKHIIEPIMSMNPDGLDPIEPPPQGDVELLDIRRRFGDRLVLFGNLEVSDIETLPTADFRLKVERAITQGTDGNGRGFVLMPSACPYGRLLSPLALKNYECMIAMIEQFPTHN